MQKHNSEEIQFLRQVNSRLATSCPGQNRWDEMLPPEYWEDSDGDEYLDLVPSVQDEDMEE